MPPFDVDRIYLKVQGAATTATIATNLVVIENKPDLVAKVAEVAGLQEKLFEEEPDIVTPEATFDGLTLASLAVQMEYITGAAHCNQALNVLGGSALMAVDIETARKDEDPRSGLDPHRATIRLIQLYDGNEKVYVFDCFQNEVWIALLSSNIWSRPMVAHNAVFELKHLKNSGIVIPNIGCTMLQSNALTGELPKLTTLVKRFLGKELSKAQQVSDWSVADLSKVQLEYAALDAVVTHKAAHIQADKLKQVNRQMVYLTMKDSQLAVAEMELAGFLFDLGSHKVLIDRWKEEKVIVLEALSQILAGINLNSGKQVAEWLIENLDKDTLDNWPRTPTGQLKTDTNSFSQYPHLEVTQPLLVYKEVAKKLSTYGEKYRAHINHVTGRIHGSYRIGGNVTGRISDRVFG